ncbi:unnamed protein product [Closterium sp. NIES-54]
MIVVDDYSRNTTVFPLRRKADVPTVLEPRLLARGGVQGLCGLRLYSDRGVRYAAHQLNLWPSDARPRATPIFLWTGFPGVAADYRVWGCLAHVRAPGANKLSARTRAYVFLGFPLDASGWVFYDPVTHQLFASQDVNFDESVSYYRSRPHRGSEAFSPPLFLTLEPPPVAPVAPPPSRPAPLGVSHVTPQSSSPQRLVPVMSGGAGGAVAEGEGTGAAGARRASSRGAGGVRVETTPEEDTAVSTRRPHPASPPGFPSVPQFPPSSPPRPVVAEPGGVPAGGIGVPGGVVGGGSGSGGAGAGDMSTATPTLRTGTAATAVLVEASGESRGGFTAAAAVVSVGASGESRGGVAAAAPAVAVSVEVSGESRGGVTAAAAAVSVGASRESRGGVAAAAPPAAAAVSVKASGESRGGVTTAATGATLLVRASGETRGGVTSVAGEVPLQQTPEEAERRRLRQRDLPDPTPARLVRDPLPSPPVAPALSLSSSQWTRRSPLSRAMSPEPCRSRYRADGPFHLLSLTVLHDPLSDYLRASHPVVSRVLSALVTHPIAPLSSVSDLVTTVAGFASSHRLDYAAHLVSGSACSPSSGGAPVFPLEVLEDRQFELGFLAAAVPHLCAMLLAPEGDPDALDIPIPCTHAEAVSGPWSLHWITAEEAEMASYTSTGTYVDAVPPPGANVVSGMWFYKVKQPPGAPLVFKARYVARGFSQREGVDFFQTFAPTPKMTTLQVLLHIAAQRDYELHSLDFSTASYQGSQHEQIWLRRPPGFIGTFPPETQWQLPRLRLTSFCHLPTPFFVLVYVDDVVFATPDRRALSSVKEELQRRHTCIDLGELQCYLGQQITTDRTARTITLTQSHMVEQILTRFRFPFSKVQPTPLAVDHGLTTPPSNEPFESSGPYPELVGCLICEAEVYAVAMAAPELRWLSFLLTDLGERPRSPLVLFADNRSAVLLCEEPRLVGNAKHIQLRYFLLHEFQQRGQARVVRVVSEANTAAIFTKALPPCAHQRFCTQLGLVSTDPHLLA